MTLGTTQNKKSWEIIMGHIFEINDSFWGKHRKKVLCNAADVS